MSRLLLTLGLSLLMISVYAAEVDQGPDSVKKLGAQLDTSIKRRDVASIKIEAGNTLRIPLSKSIHAGSVSFFTKEQQHVISDPKKYFTGPQFGIVDQKGQFFSMAILYAKYLAGDKTYTFTNYKTTEAGASPYSNLQYVGTQRNANWNKWTFSVDENGIPFVSINDKVISRVKNDKVKFDGIQSLLIKGGASSCKHTLWVDEITYNLGKTLTPKKEKSLLPDVDPEIPTTCGIVDSLKGKHPRLLFTAEDIPAIRALAKAEGKSFMDRVEDYIASCKAPNHTKFLRDATDGQRQGLWRIPTIALHWVITQDPKSLQQAKDFLKFLIEQENWELGQEFDCGMSSANIMIGAALAYDWLYHELDPDFREQARKKLLLMARRQYYHGHMGLAKSVQYWQGDPANNHRWHRNAGMVLATLAAADDVNGKNDYQWILEKCKEDMDYVNKWLPKDGTSHESPSYLVFGLTHLSLFTDAADRCLGTNYQKHPAFKNFPYFRLYTMTQGMEKTFAYGDSGEGAIGGYNHAFYFCARAHQDKVAHAGIVEFMKKHPKSFDFGWFGLVWYDKNLEGSSASDLPRHKYFEDMGLSFIRNDWTLTDTSASMMLKCGPYGGYDLNKFRNERNFQYVNIAHDDPDANELIVFARGKVFAKPDGYSEKKKTHDHNTLIVNDKGQVGSKGGMWTQPPKGVDLTTLSYTTTYKPENGHLICEGEAGNAYEDIERFRRSVVWLNNQYLLVIDDVSADADNELEMRWQGMSMTSDGNRFSFVEDGDQLPCHFSSTAKTSSKIIDSKSEAKSKILGYKQLVISCKAKHWSMATVFDVWGKECSTSIEATEDGLEIKVHSQLGDDTWTYKRSTDMEKPSQITGLRNGKALISCTEKDQALRPDKQH